MKATRSVAREKLVAPQRQCTCHRALLTGNIISLPHQPLLTRFGSCGLRPLPEDENPAQSCRFDTIAGIRWESQEVLDTL